jgi:hypothetical protein
VQCTTQSYVSFGHFFRLSALIPISGSLRISEPQLRGSVQTNTVKEQEIRFGLRTQLLAERCANQVNQAGLPIPQSIQLLAFRLRFLRCGRDTLAGSLRWSTAFFRIFSFSFHSGASRAPRSIRFASNSVSAPLFRTIRQGACALKPHSFSEEEGQRSSLPSFISADSAPIFRSELERRLGRGVFCQAGGPSRTPFQSFTRDKLEVEALTLFRRRRSR